MGSGYIGPEGDPNAAVKLIAPLYAKVILMDIANRFRTELLKIGHITSFSETFPRNHFPKLYDEILGYTGFGAYSLPVLTTMEKFVVGASAVLRDDVDETVDLDDFFAAPPSFVPTEVNEQFLKAMSDDASDQRSRKRASADMASIVSPDYDPEAAAAKSGKTRKRVRIDAEKPKDGNAYPVEDAAN